MDVLCLIFSDRIHVDYLERADNTMELPIVAKIKMVLHCEFSIHNTVVQSAVLILACMMICMGE